MADVIPSATAWTALSRPLLPGTAEGAALVLEEPLSFWGGVDPETGTIIEARHPQHLRSIAGRVLIMTSGRGSSSSSTILAEVLRAGTGPAAIVLQEADEILLVGALVIQMLDKRTMPLVVIDVAVHRRIEDGALVSISRDGTLSVTGNGRQLNRA